MRTVLVCALAFGFTAVQTERYDTPYGGQEMGRLCASLVYWQQAMKAEGHPVSAYTGTGMERHCPAMLP